MILHTMTYPIRSARTGSDMPSFSAFLSSITGGGPKIVRGVYAEDLFALPVIQQPRHHAGYVSPQSGVVTQFRLAAQHGAVGLLAHSYLAGRFFLTLTNGSEVKAVFGDGQSCAYRVDRIWRFQKLHPSHSHSMYRNLDSGENLTSRQLFDRFYTGDHLTFQTCIEKGSLPMWGAHFVACARP